MKSRGDASPNTRFGNAASSRHLRRVVAPPIQLPFANILPPVILPLRQSGRPDAAGKPPKPLADHSRILAAPAKPLADLPDVIASPAKPLANFVGEPGPLPKPWPDRSTAITPPPKTPLNRPDADAAPAKPPPNFPDAPDTPPKPLAKPPVHPRVSTKHFPDLVNAPGA